jgi:pyruvate dehydrogenase E2 component (dihydrolipoamide acetyltransferase)
MPDLGTTVEVVKLVTWLVSEGATVERGEPIAEVETDKATSELESVAGGTVLKHMVEEGAEVTQGSILAYVGEAGEEIPHVEPEPEAAREPEPGPRHAAIESAPRVAPVVRNLARRLGVDLAECEGTGAGGAITREDVQRAARGSETPEPRPGEQLGRRQAAVAQAVAQSLRETPHLRLETSVDMTRVEQLRSQEKDQGREIGYDAIFLRAMALALPECPMLAAHLEAGKVVRAEGVHLALAVSSGDDLLLPVLRDVDTKSIRVIEDEVVRLAAAARGGALAQENMAGACMALSNLGMLPVEAFDAMIYPGHSAILSVGAVRKRPIASGPEIAVRDTVKIRLAVDHRLVNGLPAARYLARLKELLETGALD